MFNTNIFTQVLRIGVHFTALVYCNRKIHLEDWLLLKQRAEVDHFFPHVLQRRRGIEFDLDQAWNLVLACNECNGSGGKGASCPHILYVEDLYQRNEYLVRSHHPLRETIMFRTGKTAQDRLEFLKSCYEIAKRSLVHTWKAEKAM